jgi:ABC-type iron transport system FetAB ATPase subunit
VVEPLLQLEKLAVAANGVPLLRDVSISLEAGERVALTGPSGCGKTTLLRAVAGLIDPVAGRVRLRGQTPGTLGWPAFRRRVILVAQRPVLLEGTVRQNLSHPFRYAATKAVFDESRALELMEQLLLEPSRMMQEALSLSEGQRQRICLLRALLVEPDVVLLDEPCSALDAAAAEAVDEVVLREARRRGLAALIVSHERESIIARCDHIIDLTPAREAV